MTVFAPSPVGARPSAAKHGSRNRCEVFPGIGGKSRTAPHKSPAICPEISGRLLALLLVEGIMTTTIPERRDRPEERVPADVHLIASARTLDGFAFQHGDADGVDVRELAAGANVIVRTRNSCYRLVMVEPETQRVLVSGGDWFPEPTEAQLVGATGGGSMLKPGWIGVGLRMEFGHINQPITTSLVDAVTIESPLDAI